jgi:DNA primase
MANDFDISGFTADPSKIIEIYTAFINKAVLEDADREELKKERGFSDEIINLCQFKSCRPENREIVEELEKIYGEDALLDAGLMEAKDDGIKPCSQLFGRFKDDKFVNNICIPYFNPDGEIFFIRPHKFGLKGKPIQVYCPVRNVEPDSVWIITESEFKAAAAMQLGYPAIGLPGIHSFMVKHFSRLEEFIKTLGVHNVVIIYDNEIKTNPKFKNYKPNVLKQWDTQWRSIDICRKLIKSMPELNGFVKIGVLPEAWMEEGKIDIDGALAQGRSSGDFKSILYRATEWPVYLETLPPVAKKIITRRIYKEDYIAESKLKKHDDGYFVEKKKKISKDDFITYEERVSNFTMEIRKTLVEGTTHMREVVFRGQDGSISRSHICKPGTNILRDFKTWVWSCGDYHFTGKQEDLDLIWKLEGALCDGREILRPEQINKMPYINLDETKFDLGDIKSIVKDIEAIFGTPAIKLAVGWVVACLLSDHIYRKYACFPILFVGGKRESVKTTLGNWLMAMLGMTDTAGDPLGSTTPAGAIRNMAWFSCLAYWLDEYRNNAKIKRWDGFFRNVYQRQAPSKGTLGTGIRSHEINAGVILSGEETPQDNALFSRCVNIPLVKKREKGKIDPILSEAYKNIEDLRSKNLLSRLMLEVIKVKDKLLPTILEHIDGWKKRLLNEGVGERLALNYAIPAVCFDVIFLRNESMEVRKEFTRWVVEESHRTELEKESEHMLSVFMEDLVSIHEEVETYFCIYTQNKEEKGKRRIALHFPTFYSKWTERYRRQGHEQFKRGTMLGYIREEPYYIKDNKLKRINGKPVRSLILSLDPEDNPPDGLLYLADGGPQPDDGSAGDAIESLAKPVDDDPLF